MNLLQLPRKIKEKGLRKSAHVASAQLSNSINETVVGPLLSPWRRGQIAMLHVGRSGSTVVAKLLKQHSKIYWKGEMYKSLTDGPYDPIRTLKKERLKAGTKYFGFEAKPFHLYSTPYTLSTYVEALRRAETSHFILLRRKNLLRKIVSSMIAYKRSKYHNAAGETPELVTIRLNVDKIGTGRPVQPLSDFIEAYLRDYEIIKEQLRERRTLEITYEDDIYENPVAAYRKVLNYLGLSFEPADIKLSKSNPFALEEMIENFSDVKTHLRNTRHEWMLYA